MDTNYWENDMSTTIHNAVRFAPGMDLAKVVNWCTALRPTLQQQAYKKDIQELVETAVHVYDKKTLEKLSWAQDCGVADSQSALGAAYRQLSDEKREHTKSYGEKIEKIIVLPHGRSIYALVRTDNAEDLIRCHAADGIFEDYSYWNNSDRPEDITSSQWSRRKKVWDAIFAESWLPADVGVNIHLSKSDQQRLNYGRFFDNLRALKSQGQPLAHEIQWPSDNRRVIAMSHMVDEAPWFEQYRAEGQTTSSFMRIMREIEKGTNEAFNQARPFFENSVLEPVNFEMLWADFDDLQTHFDTKRTQILNHDIPIALQTPLFQKMQLENTVGNAGTPASKMKI